MNLTNDSYVILIGNKHFTERYYRDEDSWLKVSARSRVFRMTAEQVLNHLLPAVASIKPNVIVKVEHHEDRARKSRTGAALGAARAGPRTRPADRGTQTLRRARALAPEPS